MSGRWVKTGLKVLVVLLLGIIVQTSFGADLRVDGVAPDFMLLLAFVPGTWGARTRAPS